MKKILFTYLSFYLLYANDISIFNTPIKKDVKNNECKIVCKKHNTKRLLTLKKAINYYKTSKYYKFNINYYLKNTKKDNE